MRQRVGILGGTFDPIRMGHIALARGALKAAALDEVLLVTAKDPPHKKAVAPAEDRLRMTALAAESVPGVTACGLELELPGRVYTADLLSELCGRHPDTRFYYLLGSDQLPGLPGWYHIQDALRMAAFLCAVRNGRKNEAECALAWARCQLHREIPLLELSVPAVSSSEIRRCLAEGVPVTGRLPPAVEAYIREKKLYSGPLHS